MISGRWVRMTSFNSSNFLLATGPSHRGCPGEGALASICRAVEQDQTTAPVQQRLPTMSSTPSYPPLHPAHQTSCCGFAMLPDSAELSQIHPLLFWVIRNLPAASAALCLGPSGPTARRCDVIAVHLHHPARVAAPLHLGIDLDCLLRPQQQEDEFPLEHECLELEAQHQIHSWVRGTESRATGMEPRPPSGPRCGQLEVSSWPSPPGEWAPCCGLGLLLFQRRVLLHHPLLHLREHGLRRSRVHLVGR